MLRLAAALGYVSGRVESVLEKRYGIPLFLTVTGIEMVWDHDVIPGYTPRAYVEFVIHAMDGDGNKFRGAYNAYYSPAVKDEFPADKLSELERAVKYFAAQNLNPVCFLARVKGGELPRIFPFMAHEALVWQD